MKCVNDPALLAKVLFALVQDVAVDEDEGACFNLAGDVLSVLVVAVAVGGIVFIAWRELRACVGDHFGADVAWFAYETLGDRGPLEGR